MQKSKKPFEGHSWREVYQLVRDGRCSLHEFGDWMVAEKVESAINAMELERRDWESKEKRFPWTEPV